MCFNWWKHISSAWDTFFLVLSLHTVLWFVLLSACLIIAITDIIYTPHLFDGDVFYIQLEKMT